MEDENETTAVDTDERALPVLGKAEILATELRRVCVEIPEFGGRIWLQELDASERDMYGQLNQPNPLDLHAIVAQPSTPLERWREKRDSLLSKCIVDEAGNRLFTADDIATLYSKSGKAVQRILNEICQLSDV